MKTYILLIVSLLLCFSCTDDNITNQENNIDRKLVKMAGQNNELNGYFGTNLSSAEFAPVDDYPYGIDGYHYSFPQTSSIDYFKSKGMKLIRLPFRWERVQPHLFGSLGGNNYLAQIKNLVSYAQENGIYIVLDMHNYARRGVDGNSYLIDETPNLTKEHLADVWRKLAEEFKDYNNIWGYDIMNEPHDMGTSDRWFNIAQAAINAIRQVDMHTSIIISGDAYSTSWKWEEYSDNLKNLIDPSNNIIYQAHIYFDKDASGVYASGGYDQEEAYPMVGVDRVRPFANWLKRNNKRGYLGEYAVPNNDERWNIVLDNLMKYLQKEGIPGTYWSAGPRWGDYPLSIEPLNGQDRPQMSVLEKYLEIAPDNSDPLVPELGAPNPDITSSHVISLFSDNYTNQPINLAPDWGQKTQIELIHILGNAVWKITDLDWFPIEFNINATEMDYLHFDIWTEDISFLEIALVSEGTQWKEQKINTPFFDNNRWYSVNIPLSTFNQLEKSGFRQLKVGKGNSGTAYIDNLYFYKDGGNNQDYNVPNTAAPVPNIASTDVISLFSGSYSNQYVNLAPNWGQKSIVETININRENLWKISNFDWFPIEFNINASQMEYLHLDVWTQDINTLYIDMVSDGQAWKEHKVRTQDIIKGTWNTINIPLSTFVDEGINKSQLRQLKFAGDTNGVAYFNNLFFYK